ncbi:MAG: hypothetical protein WC897_05820 [Candidatus Gracilibacteria bacterium]
MIEIGIKCSLDDFDAKKHGDGVDFFEVIQEVQYAQRFAGVSDEIRRMGRECFVHLPSEFSGKEGRTLLNAASANSLIRDVSREIIERTVRETGASFPVGWIVHAPTKQNFATKRGLFDRGTDEDLEAGLDWVKRLGGNILVENVPAAICLDSRVYMTEPCSVEQLTASNVPLVLDTAHLYTAKSDPEEFIDTVRALLGNVLYLHVATLRENVPHDVHGSVFEATEPEYPSMKLIDEVLKMVLEISRDVSRTFRLVCEPKGNSGTHLRNYQMLRDRIERLKRT